MSRHSANLRYINQLCEAHRMATDRLASVLPVGAHVRDITNAADKAWHEQWKPHNLRTPPEGGWDWPEIRADRKRRHANLFTCAVWTDSGRLSGLALGVPNNTAVVLEGIEGDPRGDCPLKGRVLLMILEAAACYAQLTGREEVWAVEPANDRLVNLYVETYGFELVTGKNHKPYCRKRV